MAKKVPWERGFSSAGQPYEAPRQRRSNGISPDILTRIAPFNDGYELLPYYPKKRETTPDYGATLIGALKKHEQPVNVSHRNASFGPANVISALIQAYRNMNI